MSRRVSTLFGSQFMPLIQRSFVVCDDASPRPNTPSSGRRNCLGWRHDSLPHHQRSVAQYFGEDPIDHINPDEVVACGAAIQAAQLTQVSEEPAPILLDVTPQTLGVRTVGDLMDAIVPRNSAIPTSASKVFHTSKDNQTEVRVKVYQGDSREVRSNYLLGEFVLDGLEPGLVVMQKFVLLSELMRMEWWMSWPRRPGPDQRKRCVWNLHRT